MTDKREYIRYVKVETPRALDETEARLIAVDAPLYQQKGALVHLIRLDARQAEAEADSTGIRRGAGALLVHPVNQYLLLETFLRHVDIAIWSAKREAFVRGAPPLEFAQHFMARGQWRLRVLRGIVEAPTLRPDGSILSEPGYDEATGLFLDTGGVEFPAIPDHPTRDDAMAGLALLKDVIKDFPFVPDEDGTPLGSPSASRSVALSAILTAGCRKAIRTAPAHGFDATSMETGKSLLCNLVSMIWMGRNAVAISQGKTDEEFDKRIFSILLQGDPLVVVDNIDRQVCSGEFCKVLTDETTQGRVLGVSGNRTVSTEVLWLLNGNGLIFEGDIRTRVILSRMDARVENPGQRQFDRDLREYVPANRQRLVAAALTVLRAFIAAGRPGLGKLQAFGRFEQWSNLVRGALVWLGEPDPYVTREAVAAMDPERDKHAALLRAWEGAIEPGRWLTARELMTAATAPDEPDEATEALRYAILDVTPKMSVSVFGKFLTQFGGRIADGRSIRKDARVGKSTRFTLDGEVLDF